MKKATKYKYQLWSGNQMFQLGCFVNIFDTNLFMIPFNIFASFTWITGLQKIVLALYWLIPHTSLMCRAFKIHTGEQSKCGRKYLVIGLQPTSFNLNKRDRHQYFYLLTLWNVYWGHRFHQPLQNISPCFISVNWSLNTGTKKLIILH